MYNSISNSQIVNITAVGCSVDQQFEVPYVWRHNHTYTSMSWKRKAVQTLTQHWAKLPNFLAISEYDVIHIPTNNTLVLD